MEYQIVDGRDLHNLIERVNMEISNGWIPLGGVAITSRGESGYEYNKYCQAMTRLLPNKKD